MRWLGLTSLVCGGVVLLVLAVVVIRIEGAFGRVYADRFTRVATLTDPAEIAGLSIRNQSLLLLECDNVQRNYASLEMMYAGPIVRDAALANCATLADALTAEEPMQYFAWYIRASAAALRDDWANMNQSLVKSRLAGPFEFWIAERRVRLAETNADHLDAAATTANNNDLKLLVISRSGIASIARRYVGYPEFRERITSLVETLPPLDQRRFLYNVRVEFGQNSAPPSSMH